MAILWTKKKKPKKAPLRMFYEDDEEVWEDDDAFDESVPGQTGHAEELPDAGVAAVFTGVLNQFGDPIIRHPLRVRVGFHPENKKYHAPTADADDDGYGSIVGWVYEY